MQTNHNGWLYNQSMKCANVISDNHPATSILPVSANVSCVPVTYS